MPVAAAIRGGQRNSDCGARRPSLATTTARGLCGRLLEADHCERGTGCVGTNAATMRTALEITARLAEAFPGDPCKGNFALYGLGIDEE